MKKLLYIFALVAFVNSSGFSQACNSTDLAVSINFQNPLPGSITPSEAGTHQVISFTLSVQSNSTLNTLAYGITAVSATGYNASLVTLDSTKALGLSGKIYYTVKSPNSPNSVSFTVRPTFRYKDDNNAIQAGCSAFVDIATVSVTPIELLSFTGKQNNEGGVHLDWVTASEKNNAMFLVERSNNGSDFTQVGEVKGAGTSSKTINYTFNDGSALNDAVNYYRLTDVDLNGVKTPSRIISVVVGKNAPLSIYTISAQQGWVSVVSPIAGEAVLNITNAQGQVMSNMKTTLTEGENQVNINTASLNTGIYILNITNNGRVAQTKFFKAN